MKSPKLIQPHYNFFQIWTLTDLLRRLCYILKDLKMNLHHFLEHKNNALAIWKESTKELIAISLNVNDVSVTTYPEFINQM